MMISRLATAGLAARFGLAPRISPMAPKSISRRALQSTANSLPSTRRTAHATWMTLASAASLVAMTEPSMQQLSTVACQEEDFVQTPPFDEEALTMDPYNGVILHLDKLENEPDEFGKQLSQALTFWQAEGKKGIWIHAPNDKAAFIPHCVDLGFEYHYVKDKTLILSRWLPKDTPNRLPLGPMYQVGVGAVVLKPGDPSQMLVVQEKTGPAAAMKLWKMPTGLVDPSEDIPDAAARELLEETGFESTMDGVLCFRQAHSASRSSDIFFVCRMQLKDPTMLTPKPQEEEIADIQWMSVEDYCQQLTWQRSPVWAEVNDIILQASRAEAEHPESKKNPMIVHELWPVGFEKGDNALFRSQL